MAKTAKPCPACGAPVEYYRNPLPTVDIIIELKDRGIVLIKRKNAPLGWAIPGGFVDYGESLEDAAVREAREETGLAVSLIRQFHAYSHPDRDPRHHSISTVFIAAASGTPAAADDAADIGVFVMHNLPSPLVFDHEKILNDYFRQKSTPNFLMRQTTSDELIEELKNTGQRVAELEAAAAEQMLREGNILKNEETLSLVTDNMQDMIRLLDKNGMIKYASPSHKKILGYIPEDRPGHSAFKIIHPDDREKLVAAFAKGMDTGVSEKAEYRMRHARGHYIWVESISNYIYDREKNVIGTIISSRDITERKQIESELRNAETRYRNLIDQSPDLIYNLDSEGKLISVNRSGLELLGYEGIDMSDEMGKSFADYIHPDDRERIANSFIDAMITQRKTTKGLTFRLIRADGETIWVELHSRMIFDENGRYQEEVGIVRDITDRKRLESQLLHAQKMEAIGTLSGGIAHDFNNILMSIQGYASLIRMSSGKDDPNNEKLMAIERQVRSAAALTRQLLGVAREGRYEIRRTDINEFLDRNSEMFGKAKKGLTLRKEFEKQIWPVDIDRGQMEQVFINLLVNAWQAMPKGGEISIATNNVTIDDNTIRAQGVRQERFVRVTVADTGVGMDEKTMNRIFDPFFTTKGMGRGSGLGLASAYGIVKNHGGFIEVTSAVGRGSTFNIHLPAAEGPSPAGEKQVPGIVGGRENILIVDDEKDNLDVLKEILLTLGYRVLTAEGGREAIEIYRQKKDNIDLVITDVVMPGTDGGEVFDAVRKLNPDAKVILCSGYSIEDGAREIMDKGCRGFIQKPFRIDELSQKLRDALDG